jgi:predicted nucleic acid-binding protein
MILYLDTSALVKRYTAERGTEMVVEAFDRASVVGSSAITRTEMAAALAKAARVGTLAPDEAAAALDLFNRQWPDLVRVQITDGVIGRAGDLAWGFGLRAYDAIQLACALQWSESLAESVTLATFDRQLWDTARRQRLIPFPENLPEFLADKPRPGSRRAPRSG